MSTNPTDTKPLNAECLLGDSPVSLAFRVAYQYELCSVCFTRGPVNGAYMCAGCDAKCSRLMNGTTADTIGNAMAIVEGGPDGPIREPGDDMPSRSDIYSDGELCMQLDRHRSRLVKLGMYDIAADLNYAVDEITDQADTIERLSKTIRQLAAEKVVAQNWITNLRATNASYMEQIAEQNAKLAEVGK